VIAYEFFENPPKGSTLARAPTLINGFLIANRIPAFDTNQPVESLIKMLNKVQIKLRRSLDIPSNFKFIFANV
jgi:hypothetical protein